jgi:hypothetical protein
MDPPEGATIFSAGRVLSPFAVSRTCPSRMPPGLLADPPARGPAVRLTPSQVPVLSDGKRPRAFRSAAWERVRQGGHCLPPSAVATEAPSLAAWSMAVRPPVPVTGPVDQRGGAGRAVIQRCGAHPCAGGCAGHDDVKPTHLQFAGHDSQPEVPAAVSGVLRTPGTPLDAVTQSAATAFFGHSFADVRVHVDPAAATTADAVAARAYTVGNHIVFAPGLYRPGTASGFQLLAHELTHVVQQSGTAGCNAAPQAISYPSDPAETEAERVAAEFATTGTA